MLSRQAVMTRPQLGGAKRILVKIGSSLLAQNSHDPFHGFAWQISQLVAAGREVILVSSGAIALGLEPLGLKTRPRAIASLQAAAAVGQNVLVTNWSRAFAQHGRTVAQVLLTHEDMRSRRRYLNARATLECLLASGVVPIINENDTVAVEEIKFGDNDALAAEVSGLLTCQLLVLLTRHDGLYTADPSLVADARRIAELLDIDDKVQALAGPAGALGTGGMITKIHAAKLAKLHGTATLILSGGTDDILAKALSGNDHGTFVPAPKGNPIAARKRWIAHTLRAVGRIVVDPGATKALKHHASLLYAGVRDVQGDFDPGAVVNIVCESDSQVFARGLVSLSADEAREVMGLRSDAATERMGYPLPDELIHRDDLALL
ncbi:MAG: glutamate 5-kinase [Oligoflexus sp.]